MKALRLHDINDSRVHEEPSPVADTGEALIKVTAVGICGSDLHWLTDGTTGDEMITTPFVLGHEFAGVVLDGELKGQLVAVDPAIPCESCEFCQEGNPNLCPDVKFAGQAPHDGALRQLVAWPENRLYPLPERFTAEHGAMLEPLGVALHTVDLGKVQPGMTVGICGCGPIGLLTLQVARLAGATRVLATDPLPHRLEAARELGADAVFLTSQGAEQAQIMAATRYRGVDVAYETAGENPAVETAVETCKPGGRVVLCGIPTVNRTSFKASTARRKGLTIKLVRRMKHTYPRAIRLVEAGLVNVHAIISHRFPLEEYKQAFDVAQKREGLKVVIYPNEEQL
ncbi:MAG: zinc-binding dehydrogenase [Anaerolineales bacterium]|jgi:L-iditol 2-dehydrogenase